MRIFDNKKKKAIMIASMVVALLIVSAIVVCAVVYITDKDGDKTSTFKPTSVSCVVTESEGAYTVTNDGTIPAYIRVAVVANWVSDDGGIYWQVPEVTITTDENWEKVGDFYYYKGEVDTGDANSVTFGTVALKEGEPNVDGYDLQIQVLAEAIQSEPAGAVQDAWGMTYSENAWSTYTP